MPEASERPVQYTFILEHGFHTNQVECSYLSDSRNRKAIANQTYGDVWYKIFVNGSEGYVHSDYIVPSGLYRIGTTVSETKVYADHGFTPLQKCSELTEGNQVQIIGQEGEWMLIRIAGSHHRIKCNNGVVFVFGNTTTTGFPS